MKKKGAIFEAINSNYIKIGNFTTKLSRRTCTQQWNVDNDRCTRNYYWAGGLAVVGTFATGGWGLLGVVGAVAQYRDCLSDALDDYHDCKSGQ